MRQSRTSAYVFFAICVLARWFINEVFNYVFPLLIFYAFGFIVLVVLLIYFFVDGIRKFRKYKFKAITPFIISLATFMFVTFFPVQDYRLRIEYYCFKPVRDKIVEEIKESDVTYIDKRVKLPWYVAFVSMDGEIYVNKNGDHVSVVFLYMEGYDLFGSDYIEYSNEKQKDNRYINDDEDRIVKRLGENWYYVQAG